VTFFCFFLLVAAKERKFDFFCHFFLDEKVTKKSRKSKPSLPTRHSLSPPDFRARPQEKQDYAVNEISVTDKEIGFYIIRCPH